MDAKDLIEYLFRHSKDLHPRYTEQEHKLWTMGFLATIACEKNHMDNIVWKRIKQRIEELSDR